jgi:predicted nuclease of predicted toxin-antitoxin system
MNLIADENTDSLIVAELRRAGHEVVYIAEIDPSIPDDVVFDRANEKEAVLITADKDFGELVYKDKRLIADGVILLRLTGLSSRGKADLVSRVVAEQGDRLVGRFTVVSPGNIRFAPENP